MTLPEANVTLPEANVTLPVTNVTLHSDTLCTNVAPLKRYTKEQLSEKVVKDCSEWVTTEQIAVALERDNQDVLRVGYHARYAVNLETEDTELCMLL